MSRSVSEPEWRQRCPIGEPWEPIRGLIGPETVFLYTETTAPLPSAAMFGYWQWFASVAELAGYLRYVGLPDMLSTWFCQPEWDPDFQRVRLGAREILAGARQHGFLIDDISVVAGMLDDLDRADASDDIALLGSLADLARAFTARFGRTRAWDLVLEVHADAGLAGESIAKRQGWGYEASPEGLPEPFAPQDWLGLCRRGSAGDAHAAETVAQVLASSDTV